jgi:tetratricopeptide (TPR) repeat protein
MPRDLIHFQDRQEAIEKFDELWKQDSPWILAFNGVAGQGKSTLLDWLEVNRCIATSARYIVLPVGDFISSFHSFLMRTVETPSAGFSDGAIAEFRSVYDKALDDLNRRVLQLRQNQVIDSSPDSQQTMTANVAEAVRALENHVNSIVIERWLGIMRSIPAGERFVFLLDNYDVYQDLVSLDEIRMLWSTLERARQFVPGLRVALASREIVLHQERVETLRRGLSGEALQDLSYADSQALLNSLGISDAAFCDAVYRLASGHPLITRMAADAWRETPGGITARDVPNITGREKVVEWLQIYIFNRMDETLRPAARWMMVLRWFSFEMLNALLEQPLSEDQFHKLTSYSFIIPSKLSEGYKAGHDLVRKVQIAHLRREQKSGFLEFHKRAVDYFEKVDGADLEKLYHQFFIAPDEAFDIWKEVESQAAFQFEHQLWGLLFELALRDELTLPVKMHAEVLYRAGRRHYYRAEWFLAVEYYNEALKLFKEIGDRLGEANVLQAIGDVQQFRKESNAALESYNEALKLFKEIGDRLGEANVRKAIGDVQQFRDERDAALESYNEALKLFKEIGAKLGEANVLAAQGMLNLLPHPEQADTSLEKAIQIYNQIGDRYSVPAQIGNFGWELLRLNEPVRALPYLWRAAELFEQMGLNDYAERHRNYATAIQSALEAEKLLANANNLYEQKNYEQAIAEFQRVLEITQDVRAWYGLANALESLKRYDEAIEAYTHAIEREPNSAYLFRNRANILLDQDRLDEAKHDIARAAELEPEHPYTHARQGYLALACGIFAEAVLHFEFAIANDQSISWKFGFALAKFAIGDTEEAENVISTAVVNAENEELEDARNWLGRIVRLEPSLKKSADVLYDLLN